MLRKDLSQALEAWLLSKGHDPVLGGVTSVEDGGNDGGVEVWYRSASLRRETYKTSYDPEGMFKFLLDWRESGGS